MSSTRPGYEHLSAYTLGKVIQDLTFEFCNRFLKNPKDPNFPNFRQIDQMVQAARSNSQNVAEGFSNPSLKAYIKLAGIAFGSNEELTKDYQDFLRQRNLPIWEKNNTKVRGFREFRASWLSPNSLMIPQRLQTCFSLSAIWRDTYLKSLWLHSSQNTKERAD